MDGFVAWLKQLQFDGVWQTAVLVAASLLCITFHETCHGLVAYWLGDPTAKRAGRLTLNPLRHIDIGGLLMMALFRFGWAKPVPVDMRYFKHPKRDMALTAAAGPLSNVLLAYLAVLLYGLCLLVLFLRLNSRLCLRTLFLLCRDHFGGPCRVQRLSHPAARWVEGALFLPVRQGLSLAHAL